MPRRTRAAMRAEAALEVSGVTGVCERAKIQAFEDASKASVDAPTEPDERSPLNEIDGNSADGSGEAVTLEDEDMGKKNKRGRKKAAGKGKKSKTPVPKAKSDPKLETQELPADTEGEDMPIVGIRDSGRDEPLVLEDTEKIDTLGEHDSSYTKDVAQVVPTRLTRSRVARQLENPSSQDAANTPQQSLEEEQKVLSIKMPLQANLPREIPSVPSEHTIDATQQSHEQATELPQVLAVPSIEPTASSVMTTSSPAMVSPSETAPDSAVASPRFSNCNTPRSESKSPMRPMSFVRPERSIEAIDALEEALENLGKSLPTLQVPKSPEKVDNSKAPEVQDAAVVHAAKCEGIQNGTMKITAAFKNAAKTETSVTKAFAVRKGSSGESQSAPSRAATARPKSYHGNGNLPSVTATKPKQPLNAGTMGVTRADNKPTDYLASRRRPISIQFPTPPQPNRSSKPLTKPSFQLPGDTVAAKLKAARERRLKQQEATGHSAVTIPQSGTVPAEKMMPSVVTKQTAASRARQSLVLGSDVPFSVSVGNNKENALRKSLSTRDLTATKRHTVTASTGQPKLSKAPSMGVLSGSLKAKRSSVILNRTNAPSAASENRSKVHQTSSTGPVAAPSMTASNSSLTSNATTSHFSGTGIPPSAATSKATVTPADAVLQRAKGREVFNRDKLEKEARDQERRLKEDAAKKARMEAAERSRQLSREWKEKQEKLKARRKAEMALTGQASTGVEEGRMTFKAL